MLKISWQRAGTTFIPRIRLTIRLTTWNNIGNTNRNYSRDRSSHPESGAVLAAVTDACGAEGRCARRAASGTALVALGCIRLGNARRDTLCKIGITTARTAKYNCFVVAQKYA